MRAEIPWVLRSHAVLLTQFPDATLDPFSNAAARAAWSNDVLAMYYCIGRRCPVREASAVMCRLVLPSLPADVRPWLRRVGGDQSDEFGMRIVRRADAVYRLLMAEANHLTVALVDKTTAYAAKSESDAKLYASMVGALRRSGACFVYVRGLRTVSDVLWKWCAEFTKRNPWLFFFFEDCVVTWLVPENLDRLVKDRSTVGTEDASLGLELVHYSLRDMPELAADFYDRSTRLCPTWEHRFRAAYDAAKPLLVVGAPGIGKTYFMVNVFLNTKKAECKVINVDGSSDVFTREALSDYLKRKFVEEDSKRTVLFMDEYHMLSQELKRQLLRWYSAHPSVTLFMVANRYDSFDESELAKAGMKDALLVALGRVEKTMSKGVYRAVMKVPGNLAEWQRGLFVEDDFKPEHRDVLTFAYTWVRATVGTFGPDMLSLRPITEMVDRFLVVHRQRGPKDIAPLAEHLNSKQATATPEYCVQFMEQLYQFRRRWQRAQRWWSPPAGWCEEAKALEGDGDEEVCDPVAVAWKVALRVFAAACARPREAAPPAAGSLEDYEASCYAAGKALVSQLGGRLSRGPSAAAVASAAAAVPHPDNGHFVAFFVEAVKVEVAFMAAQTLFDIKKLPHITVALVAAAVTDVDGLSMAYPEFTGDASMIMDVYKHHPSHRLAAWILYMRARNVLRHAAFALFNMDPERVVATAAGGARPAAAARAADVVTRAAIFPVALTTDSGSGGGGAAPAVAAAATAADPIDGPVALRADFDALVKLMARTVRIVDLPMRFPQIHMGERFDVGSCQVVCSSDASPRSVASLVYALSRGFSVKWDEALKYWAENPISSHKDFDRLLSVWPSALDIMTVGAYKNEMISNIQQLVNRGELSLSEKCLRLSPPDVSWLGPSLRAWPSMVASWRLYRWTPEARVAVSIDVSKLDDQQQLARLMVWASKNGFSSLVVPADPASNKVTRSKLLRAHALVATHWMCARAGKIDAKHDFRNYVFELWSGQLSPLLPAVDGRAGADAAALCDTAEAKAVLDSYRHGATSCALAVLLFPWVMRYCSAAGSDAVGSPSFGGARGRVWCCAAS